MPRSSRALNARLSVTLVAAVAASAAAITPAHAASAGPGSAPRKPRTVAEFSLKKGQSPEGVTTGKQGAMYVSWKPLQKVVRVYPGGRFKVIATLPGTASGIGGLVGLTTAPNGDILGALANSDARYNGVWEITPSGSERRLAGLPVSAFPNDLTITPDRTSVLVSDSTGGRIYKISLRNGKVAVWAHNKLLEPAPNAPVPVGANGITYLSSREVVVANTFTNSLISIPVRADGSAGPRARVLARVVHPDGVRALNGNLIAALFDENEVVEVQPSGRQVIVASNADNNLQSPVSIAVPTGSARKHRILVTDSALSAGNTTPNLVSVRLP